MKLHSEILTLRFLTPCFSGNVDGKDAEFSEIRIPPIRGQIRQWHRAAFGIQSANRVWGNAEGDQGEGSRVGVRLKTDPGPSSDFAELLPHKPSAKGMRPAMSVNTEVSIQLQRLISCSNGEWDQALAAAKLWLVAGTIGYRANRAAGSVWPNDGWAPRNRQELANALAIITKRASQPWGAAVIGESAGKSWDALREAASDTPRGPARLFGNSDPRQSSPVKFKVIELANRLCLLATAPSKELISEAESAVRSKPDPRRWIELGPWNPL